MRKNLLFIIFLFCCTTTKAQFQYADHPGVDSADIPALNIFLDSFSVAVNSNDVNRLVKLIDFPIFCNACFPNSEEEKRDIISKKQFLKKYSSILFNPTVKQLANYPASKRIGALIGAFRDLSTGIDYYSFGYTAKTKGTRQQRVILFDISSTRHGFKIKSIHNTL